MRTTTSHKSKCKRHGPTRGRIAAVLAVAGLALSAPASASADSITLHVVNQAGVPQPALIWDEGSFQNTDIWGNSSVMSVYPGVTIVVSRDDDGAGDGACSPPEGNVVVYTVPDPVPSDATIVLPNGNGTCVGDGNGNGDGDGNGTCIEDGNGNVTCNGNDNGNGNENEDGTRTTTPMAPHLSATVSERHHRSRRLQGQAACQGSRRWAALRVHHQQGRQVDHHG